MHTYFFAHFCGLPNVPPHDVPSTPVSISGRHAVPTRSEKSISHACVDVHPHWVWMSHGCVAQVFASIIGVSIAVSIGDASCSVAGGVALAHPAINSTTAILLMR